VTGEGVSALLELVVEKAVHRGLGLARHAGRVVLLPRALPGERVRARVQGRERGVLRAEVVEVLQASPERRDAPCPHFPGCGGCTWQELRYPAQLELKREVLLESLARAGAPWKGTLAVRASPEREWRTRATLHAAWREGRLELGLHRAASHDVVAIDRCGQLSDRLRSEVARLVSELQELGLGASVSDVRVAESGDLSRRVALLALSGEARTLLPRLRSAVPALAAFDAVAVAGRRLVVLRGDPVVGASVMGAALEAQVGSFFQANRFLLEPLVAEVLEAVPPGAELLDLYAGVGLFAIAAARERGARAEAVELAAGSVRDARRNVERLAAGAVRVRRADAGVGLRAWRPRGAREVIVVDPPRTGLDRDLLTSLTERRRARIVYVSCDPPALGRDLARFAERGWRALRLEAFDLFPDTFHLESVVTLESSPAIV
jgi:tRNA/tmRNA/rRNA uracil-C5-methylase (TrmA/RlmC/RlmD family)